MRPWSVRRGSTAAAADAPWWYLAVTDAIEYAKHYSRAHDAVINLYDAAGNVTETFEHLGDFKDVAPPFAV